MQTEEIISACQALAASGKKPTIALVKTKLSAKVPLAVVVKGIQQFQNTSMLGSSIMAQEEVSEQIIKSSSATYKQCNCEERIACLALKISKMEAYIISLQAQVKALAGQ